MCAIDLVDRLTAVGVISYKTEGLTKSIYYLSLNMKSYWSALDKTMSFEPIEDRISHNVIDELSLPVLEVC